MIWRISCQYCIFYHIKPPLVILKSFILMVEKYFCFGIGIFFNSFSFNVRYSYFFGDMCRIVFLDSELQFHRYLIVVNGFKLNTFEHTDDRCLKNLLQLRFCDWNVNLVFPWWGQFIFMNYVLSCLLRLSPKQQVNSNGITNQIVVAHNYNLPMYLSNLCTFVFFCF